jgi:RHS repeat-associated protein
LGEHGWSSLGEHSWSPIGEHDWSSIARLLTGLTQVLADGASVYLYGLGRIGEEGAAGWLTHLGDALGSVRQLAAGDGEVVGDRSYKPYGEVLESGGSGGSVYGFAGEWTDGTGLVFLRARYYDPYLNQFIQPDPIMPQLYAPQDWNKYPYSHNSPVTLRDPSGLSACLDAECNWRQNPVTGWTKWYGPGEPFLPAGRYLYSEQYGWFDKSHFRTGKPGDIIADVRQKIKEGGGQFPIRQQIQGGLTYVGRYRISSEATENDALGIALGVYMDWSMKFELWEATVFVFGLDTAYAIEDLPSHYLGFYSEASGRPLPEVLMNLGATGTDEEPPRAWDWLLDRRNWVEIKNFWFTPRVADDVGNWCNVSWPDAMTITPVSSDSGLWQFQGADCEGFFCWITSEK